MKTLLFVSLVILSTVASASESTWVCKGKDEKVMEVKGDTAEAKKAACEALHGTWTEEKAKEQSAGKSGGW